MWSSAVSYEAKEFAKIIRESLEKLEYVFTRDLTTTTYSRFVVMIPMMGGAQVFRYTVEYPVKFVIQCYDTYPGTKAGLMPFAEIVNVDERNRRAIEKLLQDIAEGLARPPWEFTRGQRLLVGFMLPEFRQARKAWAEFGFDTSKKRRKQRKMEMENVKEIEKEEVKEMEKEKVKEMEKEKVKEIEKEEVKEIEKEEVKENVKEIEKGNNREEASDDN